MSGPPKAWINFLAEPRERGQLTKRWCVTPARDKETGGEGEYAELGIVKWYSPWRRYCFFPSDGSLFDAACLREVAAFCDRETRDHAAEVRRR